MQKVTIIGLYSHAHPKKISEDRINNVVDLLKKKNMVEINFIGSLPDHDDFLIEKARKKIEDAVSNSCCIILIYSGWSESPGVLTALSNYMHLPIIIWSLAGYRIQNGLVAPAAAAGASLIRSSLDSLNVKYKCFYDLVDSDTSIDQVLETIKVFDAIRQFHNTKIASIGYACSNLYPFMYDGNLIKAKTGIHVDNLDLLELKILAEKITEDQTRDFKEDFNKTYNSENNLSESEIDLLSKYYVALLKLIEDNKYMGISMKCGSGPGKLLGFTPCMLLSMLGDKINAICEGDVYGLLAQTIVNMLTGFRPTFLEIFEFYRDSVLMASCGFAPFSLCKQNCIKIYQHDWGGSGGLMNTSELKTGEVTVFNLYSRNGRLKIQVFSGRSSTPEKFQEEGWHEYKGPMIPALEIKFDAGIDIFKNNIISPHYIVLHGNHTEVIEEYCDFAGIEISTFY